VFLTAVQKNPNVPIFERLESNSRHTTPFGLLQIETGEPTTSATEIGSNLMSYYLQAEGTNEIKQPTVIQALWEFGDLDAALTVAGGPWGGIGISTRQIFLMPPLPACLRLEILGADAKSKKIY
jgi:hypothetical protein